METLTEPEIKWFIVNLGSHGGKEKWTEVKQATKALRELEMVEGTTFAAIMSK